jgi:hypothetical protein
LLVFSFWQGCVCLLFPSFIRSLIHSSGCAESRSSPAIRSPSQIIFGVIQVWTPQNRAF